MLKEGMWIEAKHVKRKDLHTYVIPSLLKRERKVCTNHQISSVDKIIVRI